MDADGSGTIEFQEYLTLLMRHMHQASGGLPHLRPRLEWLHPLPNEIRHVLQNLGERLSSFEHRHLNSTHSSSFAAKAAESGIPCSPTYRFLP